jgi:hypothetical protein
MITPTTTFKPENVIIDKMVREPEPSSKVLFSADENAFCLKQWAKNPDFKHSDYLNEQNPLLCESKDDNIKTQKKREAIRLMKNLPKKRRYDSAVSIFVIASDEKTASFRLPSTGFFSGNSTAKSKEEALNKYKKMKNKIPEKYRFEDNVIGVDENENSYVVFSRATQTTIPAMGGRRKTYKRKIPRGRSIRRRKNLKSKKTKKGRRI